MHTAWVVTGQDVWKKLTKFWGKLFLINFAIVNLKASAGSFAGCVPKNVLASQTTPVASPHA